ncbi:type III sulfide quinone reductase, selenoprotein subtype [Cellulosimicrobium cellulans]|uniref:Oxidoreductase n=1 Tax=Cellulosimicrobium funkei TaxID=264251 RepID=A0A0H2KIC2_9MICO|nr:FAD/NAD(P)-binding oxidoreductase [Cellulosimicrobium funkei]KLN32928.1 oxidoreductase [Cellulosimicrobium funkei]
MNRLVILGAGTAGTMAANRLRRRLPRDWSVALVDRDDMHLYQPGLLLLPFGVYEPHDLLRPRDRFLRDGVELVLAEVERVDADASHARLRDGRSLGYDLLVIATGTSPRPDQTPGMTGAAWRRSIFDFFTLDGALALRDALERWPGGRLVVHVTEMPIKCPVAPLEFSFLADAYFAERGKRSSVDLTYVTPLEGAFTKPVASQHLGAMLAERDISVEPDFVVDHVDPDSRLLVSVDDREIPFDLLVTVPLNMGDELVARSGLGDELNYVPVDRYTLQSRAHADVFAIGDANDIPASKAGSVAHFSMDGFVENVVDHVRGRPMTHRFDGHANCFVESGHGKGLLIDFNYDTEPLPGVYPYPRIGPLSLLKETRANHLGKLAFRHLYWNVLLPGRSMPVPSLMSMAGKEPAGAPGR